MQLSDPDEAGPEVATSADPNPFAVLTPTQRAVVQYIALGLTCREIAERRGGSVKTIDTHRGAAMTRLGVSNNVLLARLAIRWGEVTNPAEAS